MLHYFVLALTLIPPTPRREGCPYLNIDYLLLNIGYFKNQVVHFLFKTSDPTNLIHPTNPSSDHSVRKLFTGFAIAAFID